MADIRYLDSLKSYLHLRRATSLAQQRHLVVSSTNLSRSYSFGCRFTKYPESASFLDYETIDRDDLSAANLALQNLCTLEGSFAPIPQSLFSNVESVTSNAADVTIVTFRKLQIYCWKIRSMF